MLGAVIVILLTTFYTKDFVFSRNFNDYIAYFPETPGLKVGDPVSVRGVKKGQIDNIELSGDSVKVEFSLQKEVKIFSDYHVEIAVVELMSGKTIAINPGKSLPELGTDHPLHGSSGTDISKLFKTVDELSVDISDLLVSFKKNSENLDKVLVNVNDVMGDPKFKNDMKNTMTNFAVTSQNLNELVSENRVNLNKLTNKVDLTIDNVNTVFDETTPEFKKTFDEIQVLTGRVDSLIVNLNEMVSDLRNPEYGAGKFIYDDTLYKNINETLRQIEMLSKKIREDGVKINLF